MEKRLISMLALVTALYGACCVLPCSATYGNSERNGYCENKAEYFITSVGNKKIFCFLTDGKPFQEIETNRTGLDVCFDDDGNFVENACTNQTLDDSFDTWFDRIPEEEKRGMDAEEYGATYGLGKEALERTRKLATEVITKTAIAIGQKPSINESELPEFFDDILMEEDMLQELLCDLTEQNTTINKRAVRKNKLRLWPKVRRRWPNRRIVYYDFNSRWKNAKGDQALVMRSMRRWEKLTCYVFVHASKKRNRFANHIVFTRNAGDGNCWAKLGYARLGKRRYVNLNPNCFRRQNTIQGTIMHEIGHALGVIHEHKRFDRNNFVQAFKKNIRNSKYDNFEIGKKRRQDTFSVPYDFSSIMHYGTSNFAKQSGLQTLIPRPAFSRWRSNMGQRNFGPTFFDVNIVNRKGCLDRKVTKRFLGIPTRFISCNQILRKTGNRCYNGGYADPKTCKTCICPWGLAPPFCRRPAPSPAAACRGEGVRTATRTERCVSVVGPLLKDVQCSWIIKGGNSRYFVYVYFKNFNLDSCSDMFLELKLRLDGRRRPWFCKSNRPGKYFGYKFLAHFRSSSTGSSSSTGFEMCYRLIRRK